MTVQPPSLKHRLKRGALTLLLILLALHGLRQCRSDEASAPEATGNPSVLPAGATLATSRDEQRTRMRILAMEEQHRTRIASSGANSAKGPP